MRNQKVYIDKTKHEIYEKLVKKGSENPDYFPFHTMKDLFMFAACLGVKNDAYDELTSAKDIFNSDVFNEKIDIPVIAAIAHSRVKDLKLLSDDRAMLDIVQNYANGGIDYVVDELINTPGKPLNNLVQLITMN